MKFKDMEYIRPDIEKAKREISTLVLQLKSAENYEQAKTAFLCEQKLENDISTQSTLASIRHSIDTNDEFYDEEMQFMDTTGPELEEYFQLWNIAMLESKFRKDFEREYNELYFKNMELEIKTFSPEIIEQLQKENALTTEYMKLIASAQIPFEGKTYTVAQIAPFKETLDDKQRKAAWLAEANFYTQNGEKLDEIYDNLVKLRDTMSKKLGYSGFTELGYYRMLRSSYTREDVERFRVAVVKYLVPLAEHLYREQAERTGLEYPLSFADSGLKFRSGNAKPKGSAQDILEHAKKFYHELSAETAEFIDFMYENDLLDVIARSGKQGGGYCTEIANYKSPFIFANFNGTSDDVETMTHEAGHAFAFYSARDIVPAESCSPTMESCEIHSMSMEFFAWQWAEGFFGEDTDKFKYGHLTSALKFIPYGTMVDHFQHIIYDNPSLTPAQRHEEWRKLLAIYMPWMRLDDIPFYGEGKGWQRQMHIYEVPFYYIDYCLAQTVALQFWSKMQIDRQEAWEAYIKLVKLAGTRPFTQLVEAAGLETPFGDKAIETVCIAAEKWLEDFDSSKLV